MAHKITANNDRKGFEVKFDDKPSAEVRDAMKALGMRWNSQSQVWYISQAKASKKQIDEAIKSAQGTKTSTVDKPSTKAVKPAKPATKSDKKQSKKSDTAKSADRRIELLTELGHYDVATLEAVLNLLKSVK